MELKHLISEWNTPQNWRRLNSWVPRALEKMRCAKCCAIWGFEIQKHFSYPNAFCPNHFPKIKKECLKCPFIFPLPLLLPFSNLSSPFTFFFQLPKKNGRVKIPDIEWRMRPSKNKECEMAECLQNCSRLCWLILSDRQSTWLWKADIQQVEGWKIFKNQAENKWQIRRKFKFK